MAVMNPPGWLENAGDVHSSEQLRSYLGMLLSVPNGTFIPTGGVHSTIGNKLAVAQTVTPSMAVTVASGAVVIPGTETTVQGAYWALNDAEVTLPITTAHASLPRIDIVQIRVRDSFYSGLNNDVLLDVKAGIPAASPVVPTPDENASVLAQVAVGAGVTSITDANITDTRTYLQSDGILLVSAAGDILAGQEGRYRHRLDTGTLEVDTGTQWSPVADPKRYARSGLILGQSPGQSIPNAADTDISWTLIHTNEGFTFTPPHTDIVLPEDGLYIITCSALWTSNATGERRVGILVDGALWADDGVPAVNGNVTRNNVGLVAPFSAGQVIRAPARQSSGAALAIQTTSRMPNISVWRIA